MNILRIYSKTIDAINAKVGKLVSWAIIPLMLVVVIEVITRKAGHATIWGYETIVFLYGFLIVTVSAFGLLNGSVVKVDLLYNMLKPKVQHILSIVTYIMFFGIYGTAMMPATYRAFMKMFASNIRSNSAWAPILWPWKFVMFVSFVLLWVQGLSEICKHILWLYDNRKKAAKEDS